LRPRRVGQGQAARGPRAAKVGEDSLDDEGVLDGGNTPNGYPLQAEIVGDIKPILGHRPFRGTARTNPGRVVRFPLLRSLLDRAEVRREPAGVTLLADHDGAFSRGEPCRSCHGLTEQRVRPDQRYVLLGSVVSDDRARHGAEPHPFAARQHDRPRACGVVSHGRRSPAGSSSAAA
jgi:hypothetical protein